MKIQWHTHIYISQAWKGGWKIDDKVQSFHSNRGFWRGCWHICRRTMVVLMHMHSGFPARKMEKTIMTSLCDVMSLSCCKREGTIKRQHNQTSGLLLLSSGCLGTRHFGSLTSHRPSTLAVSVLLAEGACPEWTLLLVYSYACIQTLLEDFS